MPPRTLGGPERVASYLTEELAALGHRVTLFASSDSETAAELDAVSPSIASLDPAIEPSMLELAALLRQFERVDRRVADFDILHYHTIFQHLPFARRQKTPHVTTLHWIREDVSLLARLFAEYADIPLVAISARQKALLPGQTWARVIHNGIPRDLYQLSESPRDLLAFVGRLAPEKGIDAAIRIARAAKKELRVGGSVRRDERIFFESAVEPLLSAGGVVYLGEIGDGEKQELLGQAMALLFPVTWEEPFGLVLIEAMACGTPVIAYPRGAVPEIVEDGVTGFLVRDEAEAAAAVQKVKALDRRRIRARFEERFTSRRMAEEYLAVYERLLARRAR